MLICAARGPLIRRKALGPTPSIAAMGTVSQGNLATLAPGYPFGIAAGALLLLHAESSDIGSDFTTDLAAAGWTEVFDDQRSNGAGNPTRQWVYRKYATGSESGTLSITWAALGNRLARISRVANAHPTDPFEGAVLVQGTDDPVTGPTLSPSGTNRLGVAFIAVGDNQQLETTLAGATGGIWAGQYAHTEGAGADSGMFLNSVGLSAGGSISGGTFSPNMVGTADWWLVRGALIKPSGA